MRYPPVVVLGLGMHGAQAAHITAAGKSRRRVNQSEASGHSAGAVLKGDWLGRPSHPQPPLARRAWIQANRLIRKRGLGPAFDSC
jgi:hypothetical protein